MNLKNIAVGPSGHIARSEMRDLAKINVICGPNNSGKTTILSTISVRGGFPGCRLDSTATETVVNAVASAHPNLTPDAMRMLKAKCRTAIPEILPLHDVWFLDQFEEFQHSLDQRLPRQSGDSQLKSAFAKLLGPMPKATLVPPKRSIPISQGISLQAHLDDQGMNIPSFLFRHMTQLSGSDDRSKAKRLIEAFSYVTRGCELEITTVNTCDIQLNFRPPAGPSLIADSCGLGLRDVLVILTHAIFSDVPLLLIEEPENHLHPDLQRLLVQFLKAETDKQYIFSTHSNVFLDNAVVDRVFRSSYDGTIRVSDVTSKASALDDLGYSVVDNLLADAVILVEGPTDVPVIEQLLIKLDLIPKFNIRMWPLGGDIMSQVDLSAFTDTYRVFAVVDNDPKSKRHRDKFVEMCHEKSVNVVKLKGYAIENYFTVRILREVFVNQIPAEVTTLTMSKKLVEQIGINVKGWNRELARRLTLEELEGTDLLEFVETVREFCEGENSRTAAGR